VALKGGLLDWYLVLFDAKDKLLRHTVFICSTCRKNDDTSPEGEKLASELKVLFANSDNPIIRDFDVQAFECMSACANPTAISFRAKGKAAYLFSGIDPATDHDDILAFADLYQAADDGWIEDARPCGRLRFCLIGRIPAQDAKPYSITEPE
jgi:predicted metal-binding protein